uniref:Uncharacterized protein n=1 Tax=Sphaerodactylus townsendi TaxID=933632 RepID=A0ACB8ED51_9SAUR
MEHTVPLRLGKRAGRKRLFRHQKCIDYLRKTIRTIIRKQSLLPKFSLTVLETDPPPDLSSPRHHDSNYPRKNESKKDIEEGGEICAWFFLFRKIGPTAQGDTLLPYRNA